MEEFDSNDNKLKVWLKYLNIEFGFCSFCNVTVKYGKAGSQAFIQHIKKVKHQGISNAFVNKKQIKLTSKTSNTTKSSHITKTIFLMQHLLTK